MEIFTSLLQEIRWTVRRLGKTPRFTWLAILMLSLALGAHLAVVTIIDTVILQPLPLADSESLLSIHETRNGVGFASIAHADYLDYKAESKVFEGLAVHYSTAPLHVGFGADREILNGAIVSANYFSLLGIEPQTGRFFQPYEDQTRNTHPVAVISHAMSKSRFGNKEDIVGSVVKVNNVDLTVIGVTPPGFVGLDASRPNELWMPTMMANVGVSWCDALTQRTCRLFEMVGRLAADQTTETAQAELSTLAENLHAAYSLPGDTVRGLRVTPLSGLNSERGQGARRLIVLLMTVVFLIVAVASANLGGLLIGRGLMRRRSTAIHLALGAPRGRVILMFVAEALVLTGAATLGGLLLATLATPLGALVFQTHAPMQVELSPGIVGYAVLLCVFTAMTVGLVPGIQASRPDLVAGLKGTFTAQKPRLLSGFVVAQIAISFVLLYSTVLFSRSLLEVTGAADIRPENVATLRLQPRFLGYEPEQRWALTLEVLRRIEALPGVQSVGFAKFRPLSPGRNAPATLPGDIHPQGGPAVHAGLQPVSARALATIGLPLLRGRDFDGRDIAGAPSVVIVNQTMAESLWPDGDAIGQRVTLHEKEYGVIGVVGDSSYRRLIWGQTSQAFSSFWQDSQGPDARFVVRFDRDARAYLPALRQLATAVDAAVPVTEVGTLKDRLRVEHSTGHIVSRLTAVAGILALLLSATGLAGVLALTVTHRVQEVAIRRSLGASHAHIVALVTRGTMGLVAFALGCGLLASIVVASALEQFLFGVSARDPWTLGGTLLLMAVIAAVAAWLPARRAVRINPIDAMRSS